MSDMSWGACCSGARAQYYTVYVFEKKKQLFSPTFLVLRKKNKKKNHVYIVSYTLIDCTQIHHINFLLS